MESECLKRCRTSLSSEKCTLKPRTDPTTQLRERPASSLAMAGVGEAAEGPEFPPWLWDAQRLLQTLGTRHPGIWPCRRQVLEGKLSPHKLLHKCPEQCSSLKTETSRPQGSGEHTEFFPRRGSLSRKSRGLNWAASEKPDPGEDTWDASIHTKGTKCKRICGDRKQVGGCLGRPGGRGPDRKCRG